jgi:hypothetical protein
MRIGPVHITMLSPRRETVLRDEIRAHLTSIPVQNAIARMGRSEVKNYLAELAEKADLAFESPESFLRETAMAHADSRRFLS